MPEMIKLKQWEKLTQAQRDLLKKFIDRQLVELPFFAGSNGFDNSTCVNDTKLNKVISSTGYKSPKS